MYGRGDVVAPFTGAWIEINAINGYVYTPDFAPFTGAWIEMGAARLLGVAHCVAPFAERRR